MTMLQFCITILGWMLIIASAGCISVDTGVNSGPVVKSSVDTPPSTQSHLFTRMDIPMTDLISGRSITLTDIILEKKPVIIHTFAVWCPACSAQLRETTRLTYDYPGRYTVLAIDIDPREEESLIRNHILTNAFSGIVVRAPEQISRDLLQNLGYGISLTLPQTIILCNGTTTILGDTLYDETRLRDTISTLCQT